jgi:hypothetical protein
LIRENCRVALVLSSSDWRCWHFASSYSSYSPFHRRGRLPSASVTTKAVFPAELLAAGQIFGRIQAVGVARTPTFGEKLRPDRNATLEFAARPLTYQRFRQNAV